MKIEPSVNDLQAAFYRAKLHYLGYTLADALKNKAISIGLTRMVQVAQKPPPAPHWQDAF